MGSWANAEIVREAFHAAWRSPPDTEVLARLFAPDHVLTTNWGTGDQRSYHGLEGFREAMKDTAELWQELTNELERVEEAGDDVVVATVRARGRGRASGTPVERRTGVLVRLRAGRITGTEYHLTPEDAFEAAGANRG